MATWTRALPWTLSLGLAWPAGAQDAVERAMELAELAGTSGHAAVPDLLPLLDHADWSVRWHAVRGIGLARADWLDERLASMLDDERVAPMAAHAIGQLIGQGDRWPALDRAADLVAVARRWWLQQQKGEGWVTHEVALSPDRRTIVRGQVHAERGTAWLVVRDAAKDRESARLPWSGPARAIAFSGDSTSFAVSDDYGGVHVHGRDGALRRRFDGHRGWIWSLALSHDGALVASSAQDAVLRVRDVATGDVVWSHDDAGMVDLEFRPGIPDLVGADRAGQLRTFSRTGESVVVGAGLSRVVDIALAPAGPRAAILAADGGLSLWDLGTRRSLWHVAAHAPRPNAVAFSPDGESIATAGSDRRVRVWSTEDGAMRSDVGCERNLIALQHGAGSLSGALYDGSAWRHVLEPRR